MGSMEGFVHRITRAGDPAATIEERVRTCTSVHGRVYGAHISSPSYDGKLPQVMGWPRHKLAPNASSIEMRQVLIENASHAASLQAEEDKAAAAAGMKLDSS